MIAIVVTVLQVHRLTSKRMTCRSWCRKSRRRANCGCSIRAFSSATRRWLWRYWPTVTSSCCHQSRAGGRAKAVGRGLSADGRPRICHEGGDGGDWGEGGRVVRVGDREPGQGLGDLRPESAYAQPHVEDAADRQSGAAGQGRGAYSARLRESRPVAEGPDTGGGEAVQGTRREDHGAGGRG